MINPFKEINWSPDRGELRKFALSLIIGFPCIAGFFFVVRWISTGSLPEPRFFLLLAGIGAGIGLACLLVPLLARPLYYVWYGLAACIGIVLANVLFALVFYLLFTPFGLIMRLRGRDALDLKKKENQASYWKDAPPPPPSEQYFRQYLTNPRTTPPSMSSSRDDFEKASKQKEGNLLSEFMGLLGQNKKYWLLPLILVMLALAGILILSSGVAAPFIYTLF